MHLVCPIGIIQVYGGEIHICEPMEAEMAEQYVNPGKTGPPHYYMQVCEEIRQEWLARAKSEAILANELIVKTTAARSIPDTMAAYREWVTRRMEMFGEDNRRLWADVQKLWGAGTGLVASRIPGAVVPGVTS
jgi:hypothetical protein